VHEYQARGVEALFSELESELLWVDVQYGEVLVFTHTLMHGNRLNIEETARWSMNVRFKGLFTPYADKRLGDFFIPICVRPVSRIGMDYQLPTGFDV
jgi:sporadic carbohydrate cluster 2OG-Fe(II) oxygenase